MHVRYYSNFLCNILLLLHAVKWVYYANITNENQQPSVRQNGFEQSQPVTLATATAATAVLYQKIPADNTAVATVVLMENDANNGDTENNNRNEQPIYL